MAHNDKVQVFSWEGSDKQGKITRGELSAASLVLAKVQLRQQGIIPLKVRKKNKPLFTPGGNQFKSKDIAIFTRQLSTMLNAGIPIMQSLTILAQGARNEVIRTTIQSIKTAIESGTTLSAALGEYPRYFNSLYCSLIHAGEQSGSLDSMLLRVAQYREKTETLKAKIKKALFYPCTVIVIALLITTGMLIFIVPQFATIFKNFGAQLPYATQVVISISEFVQSYWWIIFGALGGGIYGLIVGRRKSLKVRSLMDRASLKLPIIGSILQKAVIARFARTLSTTFAAGLPLVEALQSSASAAGNTVYSTAILSICDEVKTGRQINQAIAKYPIFPNLVTQMVAVGEESGSLDFMLAKVADFFEEDVDNAVDSLSVLMEPIIMVVLGVLIGGLVIAMYMPIFKLGSVI